MMIGKSSEHGKKRAYAEVVGGAGLTAGAFGNRAPDAVNAAHRKYYERRQHKLGQTRALDHDMKPVDPSSLSNKSEVRLDEIGRPQGKTKSPRAQAMSRWTQENERLARKIKAPPISSSARFPTRVGAIVGGAAAGVPLMWHGARGAAVETQTSKAVTDKDVDAFMPAALAGGAAWHAPSYAYSYTAGRKQERSLTPGQKDALKAAREEHGLGRGSHVKGDREFVNFNRNYPKGLPGWRSRRVMSRTHAGKTGMAITTGVATAAGLANVKYQRSKSVKKSSDVLQMPSWYQVGIPMERSQSDPISPLAMYASSRIMVDNGAALLGRKLNRRERNQATRHAYQFIGARGLAYSPLGMLG